MKRSKDYEWVEQHQFLEHHHPHSLTQVRGANIPTRRAQEHVLDFKDLSHIIIDAFVPPSDSDNKPSQRCHMPHRTSNMPSCSLQSAVIIDDSSHFLVHRIIDQSTLPYLPDTYLFLPMHVGENISSYTDCVCEQGANRGSLTCPKTIHPTLFDLTRVWCSISTCSYVLMWSK